MHCQWWFQLIWYFIFEKSRKSGDIPEDWRKANVSPIHKKALKVAPGNYKPVSLTSIPGKVREPLRVRWRTWLGKASMDSPRVNCAWQNFYSKVTCLVDVGWAEDITYLDFSRAFSMVSHSLFLEKLMRYSLDKWSVMWADNWLAGNTQQVEEKLARCHRWGPPGPKAV